MSRKDPQKRRKKKQKIVKRRRDYLKDRNRWQKLSPIKLATMLDAAAPGIEAAGSIQRAVRLGIINVDPATLREIESLVPTSRGGKLSHPDATRDWERVVQDAVKRRNVDLQQMRQFLDGLPEVN